MAKERRIKRLEQLILEVVAETVLREVRDPRVGMVSITRVRLAPDMTEATVGWSTLAEEGQRRRQAHGLEDALPLLQRRVAEALHTRVTPALRLRFDKSLEQAQRLGQIFEQLREERGEPLPEAGAEGETEAELETLELDLSDETAELGEPEAEEEEKKPS